MILRKIKLNNIRSYEDQEICFPEGSILLAGDIGSGKTSILLGIEFALFGLQPGQRGHSLLKNGKKEGGVVIEFEIDGKEILIERLLKRGKTVAQDNCAITIDGNRKESSVSELKETVLGLLNYPREFAKKQNLLYKFTVYTPQEEMKQIILQDSETRINTLRHIFGIDKYKRIIENTSVVASKLREEKRMKEGMISNLEQEKSELELKKEQLRLKQSNIFLSEKDVFIKKTVREELEKNMSEISKKIDDKNKLQQEIEKTKIMVSNKKETISESNKRLAEIKLQIEKLESIPFDESEIKKLTEELLQAKKEIQKLNEKNIETISQINSFNMINEENEKIEKQISNLESCPTCLQTVDAVYRANVLNKSRSKIVENNKKVEILRAEKLENLKKLASFDALAIEKNKKLQELNIIKLRLGEIDERKEKTLQIQKNNSLLEKDVEMLVKHLELLKDSVAELSKYDSLFESKQKELEEAKRQEKYSEIKFAELKKEIEFLTRNVETLVEKINKIEIIKKELMYITELENWLSKKFLPVVAHIEKNVMIKLRSDFTKLFEEWFSMLVSDSFTVRLTDDFTPILEQQDYEIDYAYLSGGERTAVALAYRLALNQVINSMLSKIKTKDIVILDEPTDGFSEQQLDKMRDVLQQLNVKQLIIVSHEQKIEGFVENVLKFKKDTNGVSRIE